MKKRYIIYWKNKINNNEGKLRTYKTFKNNFIFEPYLNQVNNSNDRKSLTRLRTSAHNLEIERGRYLNIPAEERTCKLCNKDIGTEVHFLLECEKLSTIRNKHLKDILNTNPNLNTLNKSNLFIYLVSSEHSLINQIAKLTNQLDTERNRILNN